jgi:hypothetical protein
VSLARHVIDQAEGRELRGETVPASEKVVSLVEPHTARVTDSLLAGETEVERVSPADGVQERA